MSGLLDPPQQSGGGLMDMIYQSRNVVPWLLTGGNPYAARLADKAREFGQGAAESVWQAVTLPGRAVSGQIGRPDEMPPEQAVAEAMNFAGNVTLGGLGSQGAGAFGSMRPNVVSMSGAGEKKLSQILEEKYPGVDFHVSEGNGAVKVNKIVVPKELRNQGIGSQFMRDVIDYADAKGMPVGLTPDSAFGGSKSRLESWYQSLGFVRNKGKNADYSVSESYVKQPKR